MNSSIGGGLGRLATVLSALVTLLSSQVAAAEGPMIIPGGQLDRAYPKADIYLETPHEPSIPPGAACQVAKRYVDLVNAGKYAEIAELYADDATFLEPVRPSLQGKQAIRDFYTRRIGSFQPEVTPVAFIGNDVECVMELAMKMEIDGRPRWLLVSVDHFVLDGDGDVKLMVVFSRPPTEEIRALLEATE